MIIGSHVNFGSEQLLGSAKQAVSFGANTFMFYTGAPQNTIRKDIKDDLTDEAIKYMKENNIDINNVICHAPYIINLANKEKEDSWNFSISFLKNEINRITKMGINYIVVHPGNALKIDRMEALNNIAEKFPDNVEVCREILKKLKNTFILFQITKIIHTSMFQKLYKL